MPRTARPLRPRRRPTIRLGLLPALLLAWGCSDAAEPAGPQDPDPPEEPDTPERIVAQGVDITLKSGTQRIPSSLAGNALLETDPAMQTFTFDADELDAADVTIRTGEILMIDGIALRRVTGVSTSGGQLVVTTGGAALTDAIEDGTIEWDAPLDFTPEALLRARVRRPDGTILGPASVSSNGAVVFQYTVGEYTYNLDILPINGPAQVVLQVSKTSGSRITSVFTFRGTIAQGRAQGDVAIQDGVTEHFEYRNAGVQGTIDLEFSIAGDTARDFSFEFPEPFITFPIQVGPIPILVTLKMQVATRISVPLAFQASANMKTRFQYSGDTGFEYAGGSFTNTSTMPAPALGPSLADAAALIGGPVDAQIRLGIPRAEFGFFGNTIVPFVRIELFAGTQLYWGPICKTATVQYLVTAGADLTFLGKPLASLPGDTLVGPYTLTPPDNQCGQTRPLLAQVRFGVPATARDAMH